MLVTVAEVNRGIDLINVCVHIPTRADRYVSVPFPLDSREVESELKWLVEQSDSDNPATSSIRESKCVRVLRLYGENLFKTVFESSLEMTDHVHILIRGNSDLQALHWEAMVDPLRGPVALDIARSISRTPDLLNDSRLPVIGHKTLNVLFIASRTKDPARDIPLRAESIPLLELAKLHNLRLRLDVVRPGTLERLRAVLNGQNEMFYDILHLDCHGDTSQQESRIVLEGEGGQRKHFVRWDEISSIVDKYKIPIVLINACRSAYGSSSFAHSLFEGSNARYVIAFGYDVLMSTSKRLFSSFYFEILKGKSVYDAISTARRSLASDKARLGVKDRKILREDWFIPVCYGPTTCVTEAIVRTEVVDDMYGVQELDARNELLRRKWRDADDYFIGREDDLQKLERQLFQHVSSDNIVLVEGMQGVGKTSFLEYTTWWWRVVGMVRRRYWFSFADKLYNADDIAQNICEEWSREEVSSVNYVDGYWRTRVKRKKSESRLEFVRRMLLSERHVLVLDDVDCLSVGRNCESENLTSSKATVRAQMMSDIVEFLGMLHGGETVVLLGSRGEESDLLRRVTEQGHAGTNVMRLSKGYPCVKLHCLDYDASFRVASRILPEPPNIKTLPWFSSLLRLMNGIPDVLKRILPKVNDFAQRTACTRGIALNYAHEEIQQCTEWLQSSSHCCSRLPDEQLLVAIYLSHLHVSVSTTVLNLLKTHVLDTHNSITAETFEWCLESLRRCGLLNDHEKVRGLRFHPGFLAEFRSTSYSKRTLCPGDDTPSSLLRLQCVMAKYRITTDEICKGFCAIYVKFAELATLQMLSRKEPGRQLDLATVECEISNLEWMTIYAARTKMPFVRYLYPIILLYHSRNDMSELLLLLRSSLDITEDIGDRTKQKKSDKYAEERVQLYYMAATAESDCGNLEEAEDLLNKARTLALQLKRIKLLVWECHARALIALKREQLDYAEKLLFDALNPSDKSFAQCQVKSSLGRVFILRGNRNKARQYLVSALECVTDRETYFSTAESYIIHLLSICDLYDGKMGEAASKTRKVLALHENHDNRLFHGIAHLCTGCILAEMEHSSMEEAEAHFKTAAEQLDSCASSMRRIQELSAVYECHGILTGKQMQYHPPPDMSELKALERLHFAQIEDLGTLAAHPTACHNRGVALLESIRSDSEDREADVLPSPVGDNIPFHGVNAREARRMFEIASFGQSREIWSGASHEQEVMNASISIQNAPRIAAQRALAHCLAHGIGGEIDKARAAQLVVECTRWDANQCNDNEQDLDTAGRSGNQQRQQQPAIEAFCDGMPYLL